MKKIVIVIPAHNEEQIIRDSVLKILSFLKKHKLGIKWEIVVAENGSTDNTIEILRGIPRSSHYSFITLPARSRDQAVMQAWKKISCDYYMFMDADLATDISHIPEIVKGLEEGFDLVIGSRRLPASKVKRSLVRRFISFSFHNLMKLFFGLKVKDLQCGFKGINRKTRDNIISRLKYSEEGFMDTEMLVVASMKGYKIKEIPVRWEDFRDSKFKMGRTIYRVLVNSIKIKLDLVNGKYN